MKNTIFRLIISSFSFLLFWWASSVYYMKYIHDVGGTYWAMGIYGFPIALIAVWIADFNIRKLPWFQTNIFGLVAADCLLAMVFYYPSSILVWKVIRVLNIA